MSGAEALRCAGISRFVDTYLDGEFGEGDRVEFESHLSECEGCRAKVRAQADWKAAIKAAAPRETAPDLLRQRIQRQLRDAQAREKRRELSWGQWAMRALPAAAAVGMVATLMVSRLQLTSMVAPDIIAKHQRNLPIEVTGPTDQVRQWYSGKVDFPVRPPEFHNVSAALRGGRLASIGDKQAAYLVYDVNGSRVSVFVFDPNELPIEAHKKEMIRNREVYFDQEHGYNVAMFRDHGVGYAITSDMDEEQMTKLVSAAINP